jgi:hypothetical protein
MRLDIRMRIRPSAFGNSFELRRKNPGKRQMNKENEHRRERQKSIANRRDWRRIHHSPLFWVGVVMFLAAVSIYVVSDDLAWRPRVEHK